MTAVLVARPSCPRPSLLGTTHLSALRHSVLCSKLAARFPEFPDEPTASDAAGTEAKTISFKRILLNRCVPLLTVATVVGI